MLISLAWKLGDGRGANVAPITEIKGDEGYGFAIAPRPSGRGIVSHTV
jgi:hypothetical protein